MSFKFTYVMTSGSSSSECLGVFGALERYEELVGAGASGIVVFVDGAAITANTLRRMGELAADRLTSDRERH